MMPATGGGDGGAAASRGAAGAPAGMGTSSSSISAHGIPMEPINMITRRIYKENASTLQNCAFVQGYFGFHRCIMALMDRYEKAMPLS